eukprot:9719697-Ditylum_brightwellii.AAC.1
MYYLTGTHHGINTPNTHINGRKVVGFIFGTRGILKATEQVGALKFHDGIMSEHCMIYADINIKKLSNVELYQIAPRLSRQLNTKFYNTSKFYRKKVPNKIYHSHIIQRVKALEIKTKDNFSKEDQEKLTYINADLGSTILDPEQEFRSTQAPHWSDTLHIANLLVKY